MIPQLKNKKINITQVDDDWVLNYNGRFFHINEKLVHWINILCDENTYKLAHERYVNETKNYISIDSFISASNQQLSKLGITEEPDENFRRSYLKLKTVIISQSTLSRIPMTICSLFSPLVFHTSLALSILLNAALLLSNFDSIDLTIIRQGWLIALVILSVFLHEIGHVAACKYFGVESSGIGFGFYFLFPVAYSDVTRIWSLNRSKRIIVNLAGFHIESLLSAFLGVTGLVISSELLVISACVLFILSLRSLNPFMRSDGYWILSDLTNTPDLMNRSWTNLKKCIKRLFKRDIKINSSEALMAFYAFLNISVGILLLFYIYKTQTAAIIELPRRAFFFTIELLNGEVNFNVFNIENAIALVFYIMLIRLAVNFSFKLSSIFTEKKREFDYD